MLNSILKHKDEISFVNPEHMCPGFDALIHSAQVRSTFTFIKVDIRLKQIAIHFLENWYATNKHLVPYNWVDNIAGQCICPSCGEVTM